MIDELKELLTVIGSVPDMALNAFIMFGLYKLFVYVSTTAGIYGVVRLAINSLKETKMRELALKEAEAGKPKEVVMTSDHFSLYESDFKKIVYAVSKLRDHKDYTRYINSSDIEKISAFIDELVLNRGKKD